MRVQHWLVMLMMAMTLTGCVTETRGGTSVDANPEAALTRRVELARQYIGAGDWENAKRNLELAYNMRPDSAQVHEAFGLVYQSTGEYELAENSFRRALKLDPAFSRARNNYAAFLYALGRYAEAEPEFDRVTQDSLYSGRPLAFVNLGMCRVQLGKKELAQDAFGRALRMDRTNAIELLEIGYLTLDAGDLIAAESYYGTYRAVVPRQSARGLLLGIELSRAQGDSDAQSSYELALRNLFPNSVEYRRYRASLSQQQ